LTAILNKTIGKGSTNKLSVADGSDLICPRHSKSRRNQMRKSTTSAILLALTSLAYLAPSQAAQTGVTGTVTFLVVYSNIINNAETVLFVLNNNNQPITTGCAQGSGGGNPTFSFDTHDIGDAQSRKNLLTMLYAARTSGLQISVNYDNAGAHCDDQFGFPIPLAIGM
jgi:hypothetical protein